MNITSNCEFVYTKATAFRVATISKFLYYGYRTELSLYLNQYYFTVKVKYS